MTRRKAHVLVTGGRAAGDGLMGQLSRLLPGVDLNALVKKQGYGAVQGVDEMLRMGG